MKKCWVYVLAMLLVFALTAFGAAAEMEKVQNVSVEENALDIIPGEIDISDDALEIPDDTLNVEMPEDEELQLEDGTLLELADSAAIEDAALAQNREEQLDPVTEEPMMSDASDFEIDENGVLVKYKGPGRDVVIPEGVTSIGEEAFRLCTSLTGVTLPDGVTSIGFGAFSCCSSLTSISIPESVTIIREAVFESCTSLVSVSIPKGVTSIENDTFYQCSSLTSISIPGSVTSIVAQAFSSCSSLSMVVIPGSVEVIGSMAFEHCTSLKNLIIEEGLTVIGNDVFYGCSSLTSVSIPESVTYIGLCAFGGCINLKRIIIPGSVNYIGMRAFIDCTSLTSITITEGIESIEEGTFCGCASLKSITIPGSVTRIGKGAFANRYDDDEPEYYVGTLDITIHGYKGSYAETYARENNIPFEEINDSVVDLSKCDIIVKDMTYTGKKVKPAPVVKYGNKKLKKGTDYTVAYKNNKAIGTATVTLKGKGKYKGTVKKTFKILLKGVKLSSLTAGKGTITVKWKKGSNITGYQVQYSLKKSFASKKTATVAKAATTKAVIKKLKSKKTYYVRIRTFKTVKGKKYYSAWSKAKAVKVK